MQIIIHCKESNLFFFRKAWEKLKLEYNFQNCFAKLAAIYGM